MPRLPGILALCSFLALSAVPRATADPSVIGPEGLRAMTGSSAGLSTRLAEWSGFVARAEARAAVGHDFVAAPFGAFAAPTPDGHWIVSPVEGSAALHLRLGAFGLEAVVAGLNLVLDESYREGRYGDVTGWAFYDYSIVADWSPFDWLELRAGGVMKETPVFIDDHDGTELFGGALVGGAWTTTEKTIQALASVELFGFSLGGSVDLGSLAGRRVEAGWRLPLDRKLGLFKATAAYDPVLDRGNAGFTWSGPVAPGVLSASLLASAGVWDSGAMAFSFGRARAGIDLSVPLGSGTILGLRAAASADAVAFGETVWGGSASLYVDGLRLGTLGVTLETGFSWNETAMLARLPARDAVLVLAIARVWL